MKPFSYLLMACAIVHFQTIGLAWAMPNPDTGPGCGPGKVLWEGWKGQKQIAPQMFVASTNVTGSYSFSIASGTSGCSHDGRVWDADRANLFIETNYASLSEDMARGGGEHLTSLATLIHIAPESHPRFVITLIEHYRTIVSSEANDSTAIRKAMVSTMVNWE